jgi:hypothetical protein
MAGYSSSPLGKKLGLKSGQTILLLNVPAHYRDLFTDFPDAVRPAAGGEKNIDFIHLFTKEKKELLTLLPLLKGRLSQNGMIWISWPKKASGLSTDVSENVVREVALQTGLVDVKVCAVDELWSGLKLVIRLKDRR